MAMRVKITSQGFPVITFSKMSKDDLLYSELGAAIAKSPDLERKLLTASDLLKGRTNENDDASGKSSFGSRLASDWKHTQTRKRIGEEKAYALYTPKANEQKLTIRSCFPGTILEWDCSQGDIYAVSDSFLVAEIAVKSHVYHTENSSVKKFSETNDVFQRFSGQGRVWLEVHGDLETIELYPGESVQVCPGFFLAMSDGVQFEMVSAGDIHLRNRENCDYWIQLTAGENGGVVYCHSVNPKQFWEQKK